MLESTFAATNPLAANAQYMVSVTAQLTDAAGNALANPGAFNFTTGSVADTTSPTVVATNPAAGDTGVGRNVVARVAFSERVNPITLSSATFQLTSNVTGRVQPATVVVSADRMSAMLTPSALLSPNASYTASGSFADVAGKTANFGFSFTTGAASDTAAPTVKAIAPGDGASGVPVNARVVVRLSEPIDATSVTPAAVTLTPAVPGTVTLARPGQLTFTPSASAPVSTAFSLRLRAARQDWHRHDAVQQLVHDQRLGAADATAPTVTAIVLRGPRGPNQHGHHCDGERADHGWCGRREFARVFAMVSGSSSRSCGPYAVNPAATQIVFTLSALLPGSMVITTQVNANATIKDQLANTRRSRPGSYHGGDAGHDCADGHR